MKWYVYVGLLLILCLILFFVFHRQITFFIVAVTGKKRVQKKLYHEAKLHDYLIISDYTMQVEENRFRNVDTILFGNKFIYVIKIIKQAGEIKIEKEDNKWRVIYNKSLTVIDNPLLENKRKINRLIQISNLPREDFKSIVVFTKTCEFDIYADENHQEFVLHENEVIPAIREIEKNIHVDIFDAKTVEQCAKQFYDYGLKSEAALKKARR